MAKAPTTQANGETKARKTRKPVDPNETSADRFLRLAQGRMSNALAAISALGKLASSNYEYEQKHVDAMAKALQDAAQASFDRLNNHLKGAKVSASGGGFKF